MIIAHDLGTTGNKASLHHDDGRIVASVTVCLLYTSPSPRDS